MRDEPNRWVVSGRYAGREQPRDYSLLLVIPRLPWPPVWGFAQRAYQLARNLADRAHVTVLTCATPQQRPDVEGFAQHVHEVVAVPVADAPPPRRRIAQVRALVTGKPFHAYGQTSPLMQKVLDDLLRERHFDVVQFESSQMAALRMPADTPMVIDEHNIESELLDRLARSERSLLRRAFHRIEARRYRRFEARAWASAAGCTTTSQRDTDAIARLHPELPLSVVPNGVDSDFFAPMGTPQVPHRVVFTGLLDYRPNLDGVGWFVDDILPHIRRLRPQAEILVVGKGEPNVLRHLSRPGVRIVGRVPDLRPYLDSASVVVVPLRIGGGTRLKVVEAMSMGKAIVSTSLGSEGIDVVDGEHLVLADSAGAFAAAVVDLLDDHDACRRLGHRARALAIESYSWTGAASTMADLHATLVRKPSQAGPASESSRVTQRALPLERR